MRILILSLFMTFQASAATVVSETVGQVGDYVITSREVQITSVIDAVLFPPKDAKKNTLQETSPGSKEFRSHVTAVLLEAVVAMEAEAFNVGTVSDAELNEAVGKIERATAGKTYWSQLQPTTVEVNKFTTRKLVAKSFIKFKTSSMAGIVSDIDAFAYYEKNKAKFGSTSFASIKDNIKSFLAQQQLEERLRSWFEVMKRKYKVRNFL
ncbi:hypothetical protein DOM22_08205 [Bdellovibrio sp. ZAP7]|uniref:hypothetical protein n=1 Tax=Bdellovibrio sp. ZAP7 TaxID=2231053 RepID=UPI00115BD695|nr:hypothetical protein [Bdellovibrio sp. ZAP7]QDK45139.1 hypothetical protein DOM22_08205 [Bdellovibrio sp. ZAP7]